jgi:hypothetical protein
VCRDKNTGSSWERTTALDLTARRVICDSIEADAMLSPGEDNPDRRAHCGDSKPDSNQGSKGHTGPSGNAEP